MCFSELVGNRLEASRRQLDEIETRARSSAEDTRRRLSVLEQDMLTCRRLFDS